MSDRGPEAILARLVEGRVEFVVIGGLAAIAHGSRRMTRDIDIVVSPDDENLGRLEQALGALGAVKLLPGGAQAPIEAADVAMIALGATLHTDSQVGRLDVVSSPAGAAAYPELRARSILEPVARVLVRIAGVDDLIAMKRAAGRPLDLQDIADLTAAERYPGSDPPATASAEPADE